MNNYGLDIYSTPGPETPGAWEWWGGTAQGGTPGITPEPEFTPGIGMWEEPPSADIFLPLPLVTGMTTALTDAQRRAQEAKSVAAYVAASAGGGIEGGGGDGGYESWAIMPVLLGLLRGVAPWALGFIRGLIARYGLQMVVMAITSIAGVAIANKIMNLINGGAPDTTTVSGRKKRKRYSIGANPRLGTLIKVDKHCNKILKRFLNQARHAGVLRMPRRTAYVPYRRNGRRDVTVVR